MTYPVVRQRILARLPAMESGLEEEVLKTCILLANQPDAQQATIELIADGRDVALCEAVLSELEATCAEELAELRTLLRATLTQPGATLARVLAVVQEEFLAAG